MKQLRMPLVLVTLMALAWSTAAAQGGSGSGVSAPERTTEQGLDAEAPSGVFERVVILGASLSNGSGLRKWYGFPGDFAPLAATIIRRPAHFETFADTNFFAAPQRLGEQYSAQALEAEPTLLIALDFLFWYIHGTKSDERRKAGLEEGLARLAAFDCPLVVADLPNISMALQGQATPLGGGPLVTQSMLPEPELRQALNARLVAWADERRAAGKQVVIVPFNHFLALVERNQPFSVGEDQWPADVRNELLQSDLLHPTLEGGYIVSLLMAEAMVEQSELFSEDDFRWSMAELRSAFPAASTPWREAHEEQQRLDKEQRDREREERKRKRAAEREKQAAGGGSGSR